MISIMMIYNKINNFQMDHTHDGHQTRKRDIVWNTMFHGNNNDNTTNQNTNEKARIRKRDILAHHLFGTSLPPDPVVEAEKKKEAELQAQLQARREAEERLAKQRIEQQAKREAEEKFHREQLNRFMSIEEGKLREQERKLRLEQMENELEARFVTLLNVINANIQTDKSKCSICFEDNANTAVIPCGHEFFCFECIDEYRKMYPNRGCPICKGKMESVNKIFS
jgi:hypothetical protein